MARLPIGGPEQLRWLKWIITAVFVLNTIDGVLTIYWVVGGYALEANPLMAELIETHPLLFMLVKLAMVGLGSAVLWRFRERATAVIAIVCVFLVYYFILLFHLDALNLDLI
jgi:hypothetical protein